MAENIEREKRLDSIRKTADQLTEIARAYDRLRFMAERETTSDAFIALAEQAGKMTISNMDQLATLLEILYGMNDKPSSEDG